MGDKSLNNKILVSGGAGYIGSHACQALAAAGYVPISFDNLSTGHREAVKFGPFFEGDLTNPTDVESVCVCLPMFTSWSAILASCSL